MKLEDYNKTRHMKRLNYQIIEAATYDLNCWCPNVTTSDILGQLYKHTSLSLTLEILKGWSRVCILAKLPSDSQKQLDLGATAWGNISHYLLEYGSDKRRYI